MGDCVGEPTNEALAATFNLRRLSLTKKDAVFPGSPVSSLSSLLATAHLQPPPTLTTAKPNRDESAPPIVCPESGALDDPTTSYRIRNYSAAEVTDDGPEQVTSQGIHIPSATFRSDIGARKLSSEDFERICVIGQGGYGKVFLVRKKSSGNDLYAMKVLRKATLVIHTKTVEHTKNERDILSQLGHPFIVKLHFAFQTNEKLYLILQYAPGGNLFSYLAREKLFREATAAFYIAELLLAIEHLHSLGIIYRDLKPENVLLDKCGHILLTDFGLSKVALETRTICGTIEYMAPEVLDERCSYNASVDFWSLGAMLFDMVTGTPPFPGTNRKKVMEAILKQKPKYPKFLSPQATSLLSKLLVKNPGKRLGNQGAAEVKSHRFFSKIKWKDLYLKLLEPPIVPTIEHSLDTRNFAGLYTGMPLETPPEGESWLAEPEIKRDRLSEGQASDSLRNHFHGFSYAGEVCPLLVEKID